MNPHRQETVNTLEALLTYFLHELVSQMAFKSLKGWKKFEKESWSSLVLPKKTTTLYLLVGKLQRLERKQANSLF